MPWWLTALAAVLTGVGVLLSGVAALLAYLKSRQIKTVVDGNRRITNDLVVQVAYVRGQADALLALGQHRDHLPPPPDLGNAAGAAS